MPLIPLPTESSTDTADDNKNTRCINMYAIKSQPNSVSPFYLQSCFGLNTWVEVGTGPIRNHKEFEENLYVASGTKIFKVEPDETATEWGVISNGANMPMAAGFDFVLAAGESGELYLIDDDGVEQITTPDPVQDVHYFQGVFVFIVKDAATPGEYFTSKVTPDIGDKISFDVADFANAETESDPAVGVVRKNDLLWILGTKTVEVFSFGDGIPFPAVGGLFFDVGCASRDSITTSTKNVYWIGSDNTILENGEVVSTNAVETAIANAPFVDGSYGYSFKELGQEFVAFTFGLDSTWVFDIKERLWHERQTYLRDDWQPTTGINFAGRQLVGDSLSGKLFELDRDTHDFDGQPRICVVQTPYIHAEGDKVKLGPLYIKLNGSAGTSEILDPQIMIKYSQNGGNVFSSEIRRSMGARGDFRDPVKVARMGRAQDTLFRFSVSDAVKFQLIQLWTGAKLGSKP